MKRKAKSMLNKLLVKDRLAEFLKEDLNFGDLSSECLPDVTTTGKFIAKMDGVMCGEDIPGLVYELLGGDASYSPLVHDGERFEAGCVLGTAEGSVRTLLSGERLSLNMIQRMCGIATKTNCAVTLLNDSSIALCDTRKTTPGLRMFDKYAVACGGGHNHRFDLTGAVMLKDNHIALAGGIVPCVERIRRRTGPLTPIEVEVETVDELREAVDAGADVIMFDNQPPETIGEWKKLVPDHIGIEASGGINMETIATFRGCGADFLSMGELTNDVTPLDISFLVENAVKS